MSDMCKCRDYVYGNGLYDEVRLAGFEGKALPNDFVSRVDAVLALADGEDKISGCDSLYAESLALPVTANRTLDPYTLKDIVAWCPVLQSPFTYELPANHAERRDAAWAALLAGPDKEIVLAAREFAEKSGADFTQEDVYEFLKGRESLTSAQCVAVNNISAGRCGVADAGSFSNPFRMDAEALSIGAAFGIVFAPKPEVAAKAAMTYASVGYFKAGVYAAMWMAAEISHAMVISDPEVYTVRSLSCLPIPSTYFRSVSWMQRNLNCRVDRDGCVESLKERCDPEHSDIALEGETGRDMILRSVYTNSMAVAMSLLYSKNDLDYALESLGLCGYRLEANKALVLAVFGIQKN